MKGRPRDEKKRTCVAKAVDSGKYDTYDDVAKVCGLGGRQHVMYYIKQLEKDTE